MGYNESSIVSNSHSVGKVTGTKDVGGLVGYNKTTSSAAAPKITHSYFLSETDGGGPDNKLGTPLTNAQMRQETSFQGWDFRGEPANGTEKTWWIDGGTGYPRLWWELPAEK